MSRHSLPHIMVAPNGARRTKADHPALPMSIAEVAVEAAACADAGAHALHLHIRDADGRHSLDPGLYREALGEIEAQIPGFEVQITTEAAGIFDVAAQFDTLKALRPAAASISVREIASDPSRAPEIYRLCEDSGTKVQHILYDRGDWDLASDWHQRGIISPQQCDVLFVLGRYAPPQNATAQEVGALPCRALSEDGAWMVCAFGPAEHTVLLAAAAKGAALRIGFENNFHAPDGTLAASNAANVAALKAALAKPGALCP